MRKDMHKVIIETGRTRYRVKGINKRYENLYNSDIEDVPTGGKEGIKKPYRQDPATQNDKLSPIRRYLRSQVGRPWNDVYSEICKTFNGNGVLQDHIKRHIVEDLIEIRTRMVDGEIWSFDGQPYRIDSSYQMFRSNGTLYVHPETGLICVAESRVSRKKIKAQREAKRQQKVKEIGYKRLAIQVNGLWYYVEVGDIPTTFKEVEMNANKINKPSWKVKQYDQVFDALLKKWVALHDYVAQDERLLYYGSYNVYAKCKRLLGKKELKKFSLKNKI